MFIISKSIKFDIDRFEFNKSSKDLSTHHDHDNTTKDNKDSKSPTNIKKKIKKVSKK